MDSVIDLVWEYVSIRQMINEIEEEKIRRVLNRKQLG